MEDSFSTQLIQKSEPAYVQVERSLRESIESGKISAGTQLPSINQLAKQFNTSVFTIQTALTPLVRDGLVERTRRRGTFVLGNSKRLTSLAIYIDSNYLHAPDMVYQRELLKILEGEFDREGVRHQLIFSRKDSSPSTELLGLVDRQEIQTVIIPCSNMESFQWLSKLSCPQMFLSSGKTNSRVWYDWGQMQRLAFEELKRQGCRKVGAIIPMTTLYGRPSSECIQFFHDMVEVTGELGLELRDEWIRTPSSECDSSMFEEFGYQQFHELWRLKDRPEGIFVHPDLVVRGCIMSMLQLSVETPKDIKVVFHRNEEIPVLCPLQASWVVSNVREIANTVIRQTKRQLAGEAIVPVKVPYRLESLKK